MKVFIEFDTEINNSFSGFGLSEEDIVVSVLKQVIVMIEDPYKEQYNIIGKQGHTAIGMLKIIE